MNIDRKFRILAVNPCKADHVYTENEGIFFCAHDMAVPTMLRAYYDKCKELGCETEHLESILLLRERVIAYQADNTDKTKIPDTDTECEIDRCIGGIGVE